MSGVEAAGWHCGKCGRMNVDEDTACVSCGASRTNGEFLASPLIEKFRESNESDEGLLSLIAGATLFVLLMAAVLVAFVRGRDPRNFDNLFVNSSGVWVVYALLAVAIPTQIAALVLVVVLHRRKIGAGPDVKRNRIGVGKILGIVGGFITVMGVFLPWATISYSYSSVPGTIDSFAATFGFLGVVVLLFGLIGIEYVAIPTEGTTTAGAVFGAMALLVSVAVFGGSVFGKTEWGGPPPLSSQTSPGSGLYVSILGSLVLIAGSALAYLHEKQAVARTPMSVLEAPTLRLK